MIKVAITGTGFMGSVHAEALRRLPGIELVGIHGSTPQKSERAAAELGIATAYPRYEELLADDSVDAIHITTPNRLHFGQCVAAIRAGKHVLCEKPLAMTSDETRQLVALAAASNVVTGVNYNTRFYPLNQQARALLGGLGDVHSVVGSYVQDWLLYDTDYNWRVLAEAGGPLRAVADIGTHWLDLVQHLTGKKVESVCADLHTVHPVRRRPLGEVETFSGKLGGTGATEPVDITTDDLGSILIRFGGGGRGNLFVSQATAGRKNCLRYEIATAGSTLAWDSERPNELWQGHRDRPNETLLKDPALAASAAPFIDYPGGHNEGFPDTFKMCFRAFYAQVADRSSAPPFATFADGHHEALACEAILTSHRERRWVDVGS